MQSILSFSTLCPPFPTAGGRARLCAKSKQAALQRCLRARSVAADTGAESASIEASATVKGRKYVMVSGKGGVGKTSLSAALAVKYAEAGHDTLVVSTDPAHSLGDSLGQRLPGGKPVPIEGTDLPLWGMEIDPEAATAEFRAAFSSGAATAKAAKGVLSRFGFIGEKILGSLSDLKLGDLLETPPPGLDEAIAISKVVEFVESEDYARFTRIVIDTAPTGHTLRMLALPDFVSSSLDKISTLTRKLGGPDSALAFLFGNADMTVAARLRRLQERVELVSTLFRDQEQLEFVIATIPTVLAVSESARLQRALQTDGVSCSTIIVNQVIGDQMGDAFLKLKLKEQAAAMQLLAQSPSLAPLELVKGKMLDLEVRGVPALTYFGSTVWAGMEAPAGGEGDGASVVRAGDRRYYLLGGKGGVGKTTAAAALAIHLATQGIPTLVVSTDPAHSLSDSLAEDVSGGTPVRLQGTEMPIWGMQIDPEEAREELRSLARGEGGDRANETLRSVGLGVVADQLQDLKLGELLDNPPPGVDEAIAISRVLRFARNPDYASFQAIVIDTAPTGHTLRLLTLPDFLDSGVGKLVRLRFALAGALSKVTSFFSPATESGRAVDEAMDKLKELQGSMEEARQLFRNAETTEFIVVTIPTVMAMAESERLAASLQKEGVPVRRIIVNQMVDEGATEAFLNSRRQDQQAALRLLRDDPDLRGLRVVEAPMLDLEVRGVPALRYFGSQVWTDIV